MAGRRPQTLIHHGGGPRSETGRRLANPPPPLRVPSRFIGRHGMAMGETTHPRRFPPTPGPPAKPAPPASSGRTALSGASVADGRGLHQPRRL